MQSLKLALMDMNNGVANQGMRGLRNIVRRFRKSRLRSRNRPGTAIR